MTGSIQKNNGYTGQAAANKNAITAADLLPESSCTEEEAITEQSSTITGPAALPEKKSPMTHISSRASLSSILFNQLSSSQQKVVHLSIS
jgi:hypothetical protein